MHLLSLQADKAGGLTPADSTRVSTPLRTEANTPRSGMPSPSVPVVAAAEKLAIGSPMSPGPAQDALTPDALDLTNDRDLINEHTADKAPTDEDGPSAADYDPTVDMQEDERRDEQRHAHDGVNGDRRRDSAAGHAPAAEHSAAVDSNEKDGDESGGDFDMFSDDPDDENYPVPKASSRTVAVQATKLPVPLPNGGILEGDDKDGYYKIRPGEVLDGRYQIQSTLGKGMFSGVARAIDMERKTLVAIKVMRNNDALRKGGFTEIAILEKLNGTDPENKKHIVRFETSFTYKGHLCMVFENLSMNLREVLKKFGNNRGINLRGVRVYAYQIFLALAHLRKCSIVHADLKPDNILVGVSAMPVMAQC
jgi:serine/threonine-protein kinase PRP4